MSGISEVREKSFRYIEDFSAIRAVIWVKTTYESIWIGTKAAARKIREAAVFITYRKLEFEVPREVMGQTRDADVYTG